MASSSQTCSFHLGRRLASVEFTVPHATLKKNKKVQWFCGFLNEDSDFAPVSLLVRGARVRAETFNRVFPEFVIGPSKVFKPFTGEWTQQHIKQSFSPT